MVASDLSKRVGGRLCLFFFWGGGNWNAGSEVVRSPSGVLAKDP